MGTNRTRSSSDPSVSFHFDPTCPWTWMTARWAKEAAAARGVAISWRALSLRVVNGGEIKEEYRPIMDASFAALRLVEALADAGRYEDAGRFYTALGERTHQRGERLLMAIVGEAAGAAGLGDMTATLTDETWDDAVTRSTKEAVEAAGGDVGSPILRWHDPDAAVFGPIVNPPPTGEEALALWDAIATAAALPQFYEVKRGGKGRPQP